MTGMDCPTKTGTTRKAMIETDRDNDVRLGGANGAASDGVPASAASVAAMPRHLGLALASLLGVLLAGALYLIAVRGPALLLDLSTMGGLFCL